MLAALSLVGATYSISPRGVFSLLLVIVVVVLFNRVRRQARLKQSLASLRSKWGIPDTAPRDLDTLKEYYECYSPAVDEATHAVDDSTWNDLHLDAIYTQVDRTCSTAGSCVLYQILRRPVLSEPELRKRGEFIRIFEQDPQTRQTIQLQLLMAGKSHARPLISLIFSESLPSPVRWLASFLTALAIIFFGGLLLGGGPLFVAGCFVLFAVNQVVHNRIKKRLLGRLTAMRQLGYLIKAAAQIGGIQHPQFNSYATALSRATLPTMRIARRVATLVPEASSSGNPFSLALEYVSVYFLHEVRTFHAVVRDISAHWNDLRTIFSLMGELDALQSIASFRAGLSQYVEPVFTDDGPRLELQDARHPLVGNPVPNSIQIDRLGIAITGSNMSGKTTFLRTVGVNTILAQTIFTCPAASYRGRLMKVVSSMDESDDLLEEKSYYLAEAERLLKIVRESEKTGLTLALIDEPLAGTNSPERLAASREILHFLVAHNALAMLCTHDVELVAQLQRLGDFEAWYFSDLVGEAGITFDYRLREGLNYHGNAIRVLKHLGYPDAIVDGALRQFS